MVRTVVFNSLAIIIPRGKIVINLNFFVCHLANAMQWLKNLASIE